MLASMPAPCGLTDASETVVDAISCSLALLAFLVMSAMPTSPASAQILPGDFVVGSDGTVDGLVVIDAVTGQETRRYALTKGVTHLRMGADNVTVHGLARTNVCGGSYTTDLLSLDPRTGTLRSIALAPSCEYAAGMLLDQDGSLVCAAVDRFRSTPSTRFSKLVNGNTQTIAALPFDVYDIERDADSGEWLLETESSFTGSLLAWSNGSTLRTIHRSPRRAKYVAHDQTTGGYWRSSGGALYLVDRAGRDVRSASVQFAGMHDVISDDLTGDIYACSWQEIWRLSSTGQVLQVWGPYPRLQMRSLVRWGTQHLVGRGAATPGSTYAVAVSYPRSPRAPYCAGLSLSGLRPGIAIAGITIPIAPDALFAATLCRDIPGATQGFVGTLDASGNAALSFAIPPALPPGTQLTLAAAAVNTSRPGALDTGSSLTVIVR